MRLQMIWVVLRIQTAKGKAFPCPNSPGYNVVGFSKFFRDFVKHSSPPLPDGDEMEALMSEIQSVEELVRESQGGNRGAFDQLASTHREELTAFVISRLGPALKGRLEPEDIIQDTFLKAYDGIARFQWRGAGSFGNWLRGIAEHLIRNASRTRAVSLHEVSLEIASGDPSPSRALRRNERFDRLQEALQSLSPDHRQVIELARIQGWKTKEIAERMGRSPGAVRLLLFRALEQLKNRFGDTGSLGLPDRALPLENRDDDV